MSAAHIFRACEARGNPDLKRQSPIAALVAVFCLCFVLTPAQADDPEVIFSVKPGDKSAYAVSYWRGGAFAGEMTPVTIIRHNLDVEVKSVSAEEIVATVTNTAVDTTINGQRTLTPPDFDSLLYFAADGVPIDLKINADGIVGEVADWDKVKATLTERAVEKAGDNAGLRASAEAFFANLSAVAAAEIFARPLALSAAGRIVKLEAPARRSVDAKGIALPSFTSNAKGNWTFSLVQTPPQVSISRRADGRMARRAEHRRAAHHPRSGRRAAPRGRAGECAGDVGDRERRPHVAALSRHLRSRTTAGCSACPGRWNWSPGRSSGRSPSRRSPSPSSARPPPISAVRSGRCRARRGRRWNRGWRSTAARLP